MRIGDSVGSGSGAGGGGSGGSGDGPAKGGSSAEGSKATLSWTAATAAAVRGGGGGGGVGGGGKLKSTGKKLLRRRTPSALGSTNSGGQQSLAKCSSADAAPLHRSAGRGWVVGTTRALYMMHVRVYVRVGEHACSPRRVAWCV